MYFHASLLSHVRANTTLYNSSTQAYIGDALISTIYTDDGYIIVRGHEYYVGTGVPGNFDNAAGVTINGKVVSITDGSGNTFPLTANLPVYTLTNGDYITATNSTSDPGDWTITHKVSNVTAGTYGGNSGSVINITAKVPKLTIDQWGHETKAEDVTITLNHVLSSKASKDNVYLIGHKYTSAELTTGSKTAQTYFDPSLYFDPISGRLYTNILRILGPTSLEFYVDNTLTNLAEYIQNAFAENDAMRYIGTYTPSTTSGATITATQFSNVTNLADLKIGDTFKVGGSGYFGTQIVEPGDMIIVNRDNPGTTIANYDIINTNLQNAVVNANSVGSLGVANVLTTDKLVVGAGNNGIKTYNPNITNYADNYLSLNTDNTLKNSTFNKLIIDNGASDTSRVAIEYTPSLRKTIHFTNCLTLTTDTANAILTVSHSAPTGFTALSSGLYKITTDSYGHITAGTAWTPTKFVFNGVTTAYNNSTSAGTIEYNPDGTTQYSLSADRGLKLYKSTSDDIIKIGHANNITADSNCSTRRFKFDSYGHISDTEAVEKLTFYGNNQNGTAVTADYDGNANLSIKFGSNLTTTKDANGNLTVAGTANTWRPIQAYAITSNVLASTPTGIGADTLTFSRNFSLHSVGTGTSAHDEIDIVWAEISSTGAISYGF